MNRELIDYRYKYKLKDQIDNICGFNLNDDYIKSALNNYKNGYIYKNTNNEIIGIALWKVRSINDIIHMPYYNKYIRFNINKNPITNTIKKRNIKASLKVQNNNLFLYILCSKEKGLGKKILQDIETYCKKTYIPKIYLKTDVPRLLQYYLDLGFNIHMILNPKEPDPNKHNYLLVKLMNNYKQISFINKTRRSLIKKSNMSTIYNYKTISSRPSITMKRMRNTTLRLLPNSK
jgi:hypothetical protein